MQSTSIYRPTKIEWITFWVLMPVISAGTGYLLFGERFLSEIELALGVFAAVYLIGFISWYLHILSMHFLALLLPDMGQTVVRLILLASVHFMLITLTMVVYFYGFAAVGLFGYVLDIDNFKSALWTGLFLTMIATSLWQVEYIFGKWRASLSEKELIEQQRLLHEYESLKRQINPHFLFNNLNILSSLISEDAERAEYFLNELSKVYRYMLRSNDDGITELRNEITFIHSYYALIRIRHSDTVQMDVDVDGFYLDHMLPAFSLQLLLENAVKHNIATKKNPLHITIRMVGDSVLRVSNNLQRKKENILSNHIGLSNISENYRLLLSRELKVMDDGKEFCVELPLVKFDNKRI